MDALRIHVLFDPFPLQSITVRSGKLRGLAVTTANVRNCCPTRRRSASSCLATTQAPGSVPAHRGRSPGDTVGKLNSAINAILVNLRLGASFTSSAADFGKFVAAEVGATS